MSSQRRCLSSLEPSLSAWTSSLGGEASASQMVSTAVKITVSVNPSIPISRSISIDIRANLAYTISMMNERTDCNCGTPDTCSIHDGAQCQECEITVSHSEAFSLPALGIEHICGDCFVVRQIDANIDLQARSVARIVDEIEALPANSPKFYALAARLRHHNRMLTRILSKADYGDF